MLCFEFNLLESQGLEHAVLLQAAVIVFVQSYTVFKHSPTLPDRRRKLRHYKFGVKLEVYPRLLAI